MCILGKNPQDSERKKQNYSQAAIYTFLEFVMTSVFVHYFILFFDFYLYIFSYCNHILLNTFMMTGEVQGSDWATFCQYVQDLGYRLVTDMGHCLPESQDSVSELTEQASSC